MPYEVLPRALKVNCRLKLNSWVVDYVPYLKLNLKLTRRNARVHQSKQQEKVISDVFETNRNLK